MVDVREPILLSLGYHSARAPSTTGIGWSWLVARVGCRIICMALGTCTHDYKHRGAYRVNDIGYLLYSHWEPILVVDGFGAHRT